MKSFVKKEQLLEILKKNREEHSEIYTVAVAKYKESLIEELTKHLEKAKISTEPTRVFISLPVPEEHLSDYDRAIKMVGLDTRDVIELSEEDSAHLIDNEWGWARSFFANSASYLAQ